jgi:hypothetical protein
MIILCLIGAVLYPRFTLGCVAIYYDHIGLGLIICSLAILDYEYNKD